MPTSVYITYNPNSEIERTLAVRLHTIGAVNGFITYLPDRYNSESSLDPASQQHIQISEWFVCFSTQRLSAIVKKEIEYALSVFPNPRNIIIVYSVPNGKNLQGTEGCTETFFDPRTQTVDQAVQEILQKIWEKKIEEQSNNSLQKHVQETNQPNNALLALLGIGVGFLALAALADDDTNTAKTKRTNKNAKPRKTTKAKK